MLLVGEWELKYSIWGESKVEKVLGQYNREHDVCNGRLTNFIYEGLKGIFFTTVKPEGFQRKLH